MEKSTILSKLRQLSRENLKEIAQNSRLGIKARDFGVKFWKDIQDDDLINRIAEISIKKNISIENFLVKKTITKAWQKQIVIPTKSKQLLEKDIPQSPDIVLSLIFQKLNKIELKNEFIIESIKNLDKTFYENRNELHEIRKMILKVGADKNNNKQKFLDLIETKYNQLVNKFPEKGGIIEIPTLWNFIKSTIGISKLQFNEILQKLESKRIIDLLSINNPEEVKKSEEGIKRNNLILYYIKWRV